MGVPLQSGVDVDTGLQGLRFYAWPVQNFILGKSFGFDLLASYLTTHPGTRTTIAPVRYRATLRSSSFPRRFRF